MGSPSARPPARSAGHWGQGGRGAQSGCSRWPGGPRPPGHRAWKRSPTALARSIRRRAAKPTRTMSLWGPNMGRAWDKKKKRCSPATYLAMLGLPVSAIGVGQVAVLVPPATVMRQGTVAEGDIVVSVESRKLPPVVVSQSVPCRREDNRGEDKSHPGVGLVPWPERGLSRTVPRLKNAKDPAGDVTGSPSSPQTAKTRTEDRHTRASSLLCRPTSRPASPAVVICHYPTCVLPASPPCLSFGCKFSSTIMTLAFTCDF